MRFTIIGAGIAFDLTISAIDRIKNADEVYIERYTGIISDEKVKNLEKMVGKEIKMLERNDVESDFLVKKAKERDIVLITLGDPLTATTHISLLIDAKEKGIKTEVVHNSSIYTAAPGKAGLQIYRFGKTATIPNPKPNYNPKSWFDIIKKNITNDTHALVLLDTEPPMDAKKAIEAIIDLDKEKLVKEIVVLSRIGWNDEKITFGYLEKLKEADLGKPPFCIILPGKLHIIEEEYLSRYRIR